MAKKKPKPTQWTVHGRFTFDGQALIEATSQEEAQDKFDKGEFEFEEATASMCDWEMRGKPLENI